MHLSVTHLCVLCLVIRYELLFFLDFWRLSFLSRFRDGVAGELALLVSYLLLDAAQHISSGDRGLELCLVAAWEVLLSSI